MQKKILFRLLLMMTLGLAVAMSGCDSSQGPAEKAGENVDKAVESSQNKIDEAADKITGEGPAEQTGEKIDKTLEPTKKSAD